MVDELGVEKFVQNILSHLKPRALSIHHQRCIVIKAVEKAVASAVDQQRRCRALITATLRVHRKSIRSWWGKCRLGNEHFLLHLVAKICYNWKFEDSEMLAVLIKQMYNCEGSLERFLGSVAMNSSKCTKFFDGWYGDYDGTSALTFFLVHANRARLEIHSTDNDSDITYRLQQVPFYPDHSPVYVTAVRGCSESLLLFLRYGAEPNDSCWINLLKDPVCTPNQITCVRYLCRAATTVPRSDFAVHPKNIEIVSYARIFQPRRLKHLCRCSIRRRLYALWTLPDDVQRLPLPTILKNYVDLLED